MNNSKSVSIAGKNYNTAGILRIFIAFLVFVTCWALVGGLTPGLMTPGLNYTLKSHAHKDGGYLGDVPLTTEQITIDGEKDAVYKNGLTVAVKFEKNYSPVEASGVVTLLYSDGYLYAFFEVNDADLCEPDPELQKTSPWRTDSCEVFVNEKNSSSENDVIQYRIDCSGWPCTYTRQGLADYGPKAAAKHFEFAEADKPGNASTGSDLGNSTGYYAEFKIPLESAKNAGDTVKGFASPDSSAPLEIGVNFQINDVNSTDGNLTWATVYTEYYGSGTDSWDVFAYPYVTIAHYATATSDGYETRATQPPADPSATEPGSDLDNSTPGDSNNNDPGKNTLWLILGIVACVAVVAAVVIAVLVTKARKRSK